MWYTHATNINLPCTRFEMQSTGFRSEQGRILVAKIFFLSVGHENTNLNVPAAASVDGLRRLEVLCSSVVSHT